MGADLSKPIVTAVIVLLLFVSVLGTWVALTATPTYHAGPQVGNVQVTVEPYPEGAQTQEGKVTITVKRGGQV